MEEMIDPIKVKYKFAANYGLILGLYLAILYLTQIFFKSNAFLNTLYSLGMLGVPVVCYFLTKRYRELGCNGSIRFGQAWSFGVWLFLFAGLIMSVVYFIHFQYIDPDYISNVFNQTLVMLEQLKYDQASLDALADNGIPTPIQMVISYLFAYIIGGAFLFLFVSPLVAKRNPKDDLDIPSSDDHYEPYQDTKDDKPASND
ncbi:MAG: DUF4199 domain-containing protein [Bacteroidota bacterium]|nr:DUF4199 domain-containing protein [Bacteroidota bacterium]